MKTLLPLVDKVKAAEQTVSALDNDSLRSMTMDFRNRIKEHIQEASQEIASLNASIESDPDMPISKKEDLYRKIDELKKGENRLIEEMLMEILPEAFAVVRETGRRLTASSEIKVLATEHDKMLAVSKKHVRIEGDHAFYSNTWIAAGNQVTWNMVHYDVPYYCSPRSETYWSA